MNNENTNNPIWIPSTKRLNRSNMSNFMKYASERFDDKFDNYDQLYDWSVNSFSEFWEAIWDFCQVVRSQDPTEILNGEDIKDAVWFKNARLNFAENLLRFRDDKTALIYQNEEAEPLYISYSELYKKVAKFAHALKEAGVKANDRVAALITNRPEAIIGMLATASIGAVWSSCSPDFGLRGVFDRFDQIKPKVLIAINEYSYNGKQFDLTDTIDQITNSIEDIEKVILINPNENRINKAVSYDRFIDNDADSIEFAQLPFDHPLYIMYSSGTTGKPKCIVHGAGGTLLQHLKELVLHTDLTRDDVITYFTTCGWMMWNWLVSSLAVGAAVYLYDGSPSYPDLGVLFKAIDEEGITVFGTSPKFLSACESSRLTPIDEYKLTSLRTLLSTGAPLSENNFDYVYNSVKSDLQLSSISGGTDIISCFMLGNPILPVYKGELQCRGLGMRVETFNDNGQYVTDEVGELVCTAPFPSRPIYFWNDEDGEKYNSAYFNHFEHVWRHGDFIKINPHGGIIVYGRSDATLNPGGVRIGTAEIYGPVESMDEVEESIVIGKKENGDTIIVLYVVLKENLQLRNDLINKIKSRIKAERTPRHVPSEIYQIKEVPRTLNGKKVEMAVTKTVHGEEVTNLDALANPESLKQFQQILTGDKS